LQRATASATAIRTSGVINVIMNDERGTRNEIVGRPSSGCTSCNAADDTQGKDRQSREKKA
jgi:hypothetical protein